MSSATTPKIALVTGAASGIGAAVSTQLATSGIRVLLCDVDDHAGVALAKELGGEYLHCDVAVLQDVEHAFAECIDRFGVPDFVHLNAGVMTVPTDEPYVAIEDVTEEQYQRIVGINLNGVFHGMKTALPLMREKGGGITITASTAGLGFVPIDPMYTATKYAVIGFTRAVAAGNTSSTVRINAICPGVTDTKIVPEEFRKPEYGAMSAALIAEEVVDLLQQGANGEVRVKNAAGRQAFTVEIPDLS